MPATAMASACTNRCSSGLSTVGKKTLWLEVLQRNTRAQRFYQRQGLSICGETCYTSAQGSIGIWYMSKAL